MLNGPSIDQPLDFNQRNAGAGRAFAHLSNGRANGEVSGPFINDSDDSDTELQEALAESKEHLSPREMPASPGWGTARNLSATANKSPKKVKVTALTALYLLKVSILAHQSWAERRNIWRKKVGSRRRPQLKLSHCHLGSPQMFEKGTMHKRPLTIDNLMARVQIINGSHKSSPF